MPVSASLLANCTWKTKSLCPSHSCGVGKSICCCVVPVALEVGSWSCVVWRAGSCTPALYCNASPVLVEEEVEVGEGEKVGRLCSQKLVQPASTEISGSGPRRSVTR